MNRDLSTAQVTRPSTAPPIPVVLRALGVTTRPSVFRMCSAGSRIVGAGDGVHWMVEHETVSRRHLELRLLPEGLEVHDLGSSNGTYYLGHRIERVVLSGPATLRLGQVEVQVDWDMGSLQSEAVSRGSYAGLQTRSPSMQRLFGVLRRIEGSQVGVLLLGESGTGKELIARAIHEHSARSEGPWVVVNCGAWQKERVRSELFGHRRGAFTGAVESRLGAFRQAHGGTLFLDEVGELPLEVQPLLLRALQEGEVLPVGEAEPAPVSVRLIAATHRDLEEMVHDGTFREDLYYRLNVIRLELPPLRERPEDIASLAQEAARRAGAAELPDEVLKQLCEHRWPGNVRELLHAVESFLVVGELPSFRPRAVASDSAWLEGLDVTAPYERLKREVHERFLESYLRRLLAHTGGNVSRAAKISGIQRSYLNKQVLRLGLR